MAAPGSGQATPERIMQFAWGYAGVTETAGQNSQI